MIVGTGIFGVHLYDPWEDMTPLEMTNFIFADTEDADPNDMWLILWQKSPGITYWGVKSADFCGD
jgi:hypothetical protein